MVFYNMLILEQIKLYFKELRSAMFKNIVQFVMMFNTKCIVKMYVKKISKSKKKI